MRFKSYTLHELAKIKYGKNQKKVIDPNGNVPIYGTGGLMGYATKALYDKPSVLIGRKGTISKVKYVEQPFWTVDTLFYTEVNTDVVIPKYLYYVMSLMDLNAYNEGTTIPSLRTETLNRLEFMIPDLDAQKRILSYLEPFDKKIQINMEINKNLVEKLLSIYAEMINSNDSGEEITLGLLCDFQEGYVNPAQTHPEYFDGDVKWLRAADINESFIINTSRTLTQIGFESAKKSALLFKPNTIAISKSGTIGRLGIIADYMCGNRAVINIAPHNKYHLPFIYAYLKSRQREFPDMSVGSVQKNLYVSLLEPLIVPIPEKNIFNTFCDVGSSLLNSIHNNCKENQKLTMLRDTLLPKLMSGEFDISGIDL